MDDRLLPLLRCMLPGLWLGLLPACVPAAEVVRWTPPFSYAGQAIPFAYHQPAPATKRWNICVVLPHIKDAYWQGVNYGMIDEARQLGVALQFSEAGGYPNLARQRELLGACAVDERVDAIILGTVSFNGLSDIVRRASRSKHILATVNDIAKDGLSSQVGVPYHEMGYRIGRYLGEREREASAPVPLAWFPGPRKAGWVPFVDQGFRDAIGDGPLSIVAVAWGDTDKTVQRNLVQSTLDRYPQVKYLVGNGMMAEAAVSVLRERGLEGRVGIVSTYLTPGVYRGIVRGKILAAPTDSPVLQARLSIDQAVNLLEGRPHEAHLGPAIRIVDAASLDATSPDESLPPPAFSPQFSFDPGPGQPPPLRR